MGRTKRLLRFPLFAIARLSRRHLLFAIARLSLRHLRLSRKAPKANHSSSRLTRRSRRPGTWKGKAGSLKQRVVPVLVSTTGNSNAMKIHTRPVRDSQASMPHHMILRDNVISTQLLFSNSTSPSTSFLSETNLHDEQLSTAPNSAATVPNASATEEYDPSALLFPDATSIHLANRSAKHTMKSAIGKSRFSRYPTGRLERPL